MIRPTPPQIRGFILSHVGRNVVVPVRRAFWLLLGVAALTAACQPASRTAAVTTPGSVVALLGGRVVPDPGAPAIPDGVVLIERGVLSAVGPRASVRVPAGARVLDCTGATISAGFWNSHVHFIEPGWAGAESAPAQPLADRLRAM